MIRGRTQRGRERATRGLLDIPSGRPLIQAAAHEGGIFTGLLLPAVVHAGFDRDLCVGAQARVAAAVP